MPKYLRQLWDKKIEKKRGHLKYYFLHQSFYIFCWGYQGQKSKGSWIGAEKKYKPNSLKIWDG